MGIGSDFDGTPTAWLPEELKDVGDFPNITIELVRRGYKNKDIRKIIDKTEAVTKENRLGSKMTKHNYTK
ncbi:MAG: hypothetical protein GY729_15925 [Desulfobacteraceae bacterium]|nr:hypothetical protein [Desulfobacteraceae bacterium]